MNSTRIAAALVCGLGLFTSAFTQPAPAQIQEPISIDIIQRGELGGGLSYGLQTIPLPFGMRLRAPDGTQFGFGPGLPGFGVSGLTFSELTSRFFGTWTISVTRFSPPNVVSEYSFTLTPFVPNDLFGDTPIITSPVDLSVVPGSFALEWAYPGGATPNSRLVSYSIPSGDANVTFAPGPLKRVQFDVDLEGQGSAILTVRAGTTVNLASYVSPATLISGPGGTAFNIGSRFQVLSQPVRLTVVPEPHLLWIAAGGTGILFGTVRRRAQFDRDKNAFGAPMSRSPSYIAD